MVNILMADVEPGQREQIEQKLGAAPYNFTFYGAATARESLELLGMHHMDVIILNTGLPDMPGLELAARIRKIPGYEFAWLIMVSQDDRNQTAAFKTVHCYDYLVTPYNVQALVDTIESLGNYKIIPKTEEDREVITFKQRDQFIRVLARDILYIEVIGNNSTLYTYSHVYCLRKMSLRKLKLILPDYFVQCHKSFIVNRNQVEAVKKGQYGWEIKLKNYSRSLPSGDKYKENIISLA